jgi:chromosome segregation ATPase
VTFVSGTNGSGKSAVLQALQCCLGVRAATTGRAKSFQSFIKTGADEAVIRVTGEPKHEPRVTLSRALLLGILSLL